MTVVLGMMALLLVLIAVQVRFAYRRHKLFSQDWNGILSRVEQVNFAELRAIADCYLIPGKNQLIIEPTQMWATLGGINGLRKLGHNADVMLLLAAYAERWDAEDSRIVSAMMRRDAGRFRQAALRIELAVLFPYAVVTANLSLQEAIAGYCLMRERLIGLYQGAHVGRVQLLEATL